MFKKMFKKCLKKRLIFVFDFSYKLRRIKKSKKFLSLVKSTVSAISWKKHMRRCNLQLRKKLHVVPVKKLITVITM